MRKIKISMNCKIISFAIILDTPVPDKSKVKGILLDRGYTLKHYDIGLMEAYDKDGNKIENKLESNPPPIDKYQTDHMYQLKGKYCNVDFSRENPILLYQFGKKIEEIQYNFAENLGEIKSVIEMLNQHANYDVSPSELLVAIGIKGRQNPDLTLLNMRKKTIEEFVIRDVTQGMPDLKDPPPKLQKKILDKHPPSSPSSPAEHLDAHFTGFIDSKSRNTEAVVRARDEKYFLVLRFKSTGTDSVLSDLGRCEEFGRMIIEKLEAASKLD